MTLTVAPRSHGRPPTDLTHPNPAPPPDRGRAWLTRLFGGDFALPGVVPAALPVGPHPPAEHDALARALACPDLFVAAADAPARERLVAALAHSAAVRGERVLVLSPDPAAADRVTAALTSTSPAVVRALAADENPIRPLPAVTRHTAAGRLDRLRREAADAVAELGGRLARLGGATETAERLRELLARRAEVEAGRAALRLRLAAVDAEVRDEADGRPAPTPLTAAVEKFRAEHETETARLAAEHEAAAKARSAAEAALAAVGRQIAEHADGKKSGFFSRLFRKPKAHAPDPAELEERDRLEREVKEHAAREAALSAELEASAAKFAAERDRLIAAEAAARRADAEARLVGLDAELSRVAAAIEEHRPALAAAGLEPESAAGLPAARAEVERQLSAARGRLDELTRHGPAAARRLLGEVPVIVGTPGSLRGDPVFGPDPSFGLLILDHAEELTEPDFVGLARLADRWVLAGEFPDDRRPHLNNGSARGPRHGRPAEPFLLRLARLVDREPLAAEADRLVCRLSHPTPERRRAMTREPLADRPDVELRFVPGETGEPVLAEIAFPAGTAAAEAKAFVARELGEALLRPCGEPERHAAADRITVRWPAADSAGPGEWIDLEPGVREKVVGVGVAAFTAAVTFDPSAGWDAAAAEAWLAAHLPAAPTGRLAVLPRSPVPHAARAAAVV